MSPPAARICLGGRARRRPVRLGLTALTDLVFILLIFFILETRFVSFHQLDFRQPEAVEPAEIQGAGGVQSTPSSPPPEILSLQLFADGRVWIAGDSLVLNGLARDLEFRRVVPQTQVVVAVEPATSAQLLVAALDVLHGAGLDRVRVRKLESGHD